MKTIIFIDKIKNRNSENSNNQQNISILQKIHRNINNNIFYPKKYNSENSNNQLYIDTTDNLQK